MELYTSLQMDHNTHDNNSLLILSLNLYFEQFEMDVSKGVPEVSPPVIKVLKTTLRVDGGVSLPSDLEV